ncbi:MAG: CRISPR-associated endoribonuclease Cas6 [Bacteroidales bacterium]|nr:CRISPR-associated endoribonuclease Cas6 [Bacteroidales bacterium]
MRFQLTLQRINSQERIIPINYQYEVSAWIYRVIGQGDPAFSAWLHEQGYADDKKQFRLFTFSNLIIPNRTIRGDRIIIGSDAVRIIVSFLPHEAITHFIQGLFRNQEFRMGDRQSQVSFRVTSVEGQPGPSFHDRMIFRAISPILISQSLPGEKYARYLAPDHPDYTHLFFNNLKEKWKAFTGKDYPSYSGREDISIISPVRKKGILIKAGTPMESKLIGYSFDFRITGPADLIRLGYYTGFGEKNSMGFGCVEVVI